MTIDHRRRGWLTAGFHSDFREILAHTVFGYRLCCPIYCCMPDQMHLLWVGYSDTSDQLDAAKFFRKHINRALKPFEVELQKQPHDHVLRDDERERTAFESVAEYIARNPERAGLVPPDRWHEYPYTQCMIPGHPEMNLRQRDYWERFWRIYAYLRRSEIARKERDVS